MSQKRQKNAPPNFEDTFDWSPENWLHSYETMVKDIRINTDDIKDSDRNYYHKQFWVYMDAAKEIYAKNGKKISDLVATSFAHTFQGWTVIDATDTRSPNGMFNIYMKFYRKQKTFETDEQYASAMRFILIVPWEEWGFTQDIFEYAEYEVRPEWNKSLLTKYEMLKPKQITEINEKINIHEVTADWGNEEVETFDYPKIKGKIDHFGIFLADLVKREQFLIAGWHKDTPLFHEVRRKWFFFKDYNVHANPIGLYSLTKQEVKNFNKWVQWEINNGKLNRFPQ